MKKRTVTIYIEEDLYEKIKKEAKKKSLSVSSYVRMLLKKEIENSKKKWYNIFVFVLLLRGAGLSPPPRKGGY